MIVAASHMHKRQSGYAEIVVVHTAILAGTGSRLTAKAESIRAAGFMRRITRSSAIVSDHALIHLILMKSNAEHI